MDNATRERAISELTDEVIAQAKAEIESLEWFQSLPDNRSEDEAIFTEALELQRLQKISEQYKSPARRD